MLHWIALNLHGPSLPVSDRNLYEGIYRMVMEQEQCSVQLLKKNQQTLVALQLEEAPVGVDQGRRDGFGGGRLHSASSTWGSCPLGRRRSIKSATRICADAMGAEGPGEICTGLPACTLPMPASWPPPLPLRVGPLNAPVGSGGAANPLRSRCAGRAITHGCGWHRSGYCRTRP